MREVLEVEIVHQELARVIWNTHTRRVAEAVRAQPEAQTRIVYACVGEDTL
jgi:hypothetical protein